MKQTIKWGWQRLTRGYDDRVLWSMAEYLDPIIIAVLKNLRENSHGYPIGIPEKKWKKVLDTMIKGFTADDLTKKGYQDRQKALVLLAAYYDQLWD